MPWRLSREGDQVELYIKRPNGRYQAVGGALLARIKQHSHCGFDVAISGELQGLDPAALADFIVRALTREQDWFQEFNEWKAQSVGKIAKGNDQ